MRKLISILTRGLKLLLRWWCAYAACVKSGCRNAIIYLFSTVRSLVQPDWLHWSESESTTVNMLSVILPAIHCCWKPLQKSINSNPIQTQTHQENITHFTSVVNAAKRRRKSVFELARKQNINWYKYFWLYGVDEKWHTSVTNTNTEWVSECTLAAGSSWLPAAGSVRSAAAERSRAE